MKWVSQIIAKCFIICLCTCTICFAQEEDEFKLLDEKEFVIINLNFVKNYCRVQFVQVPENLPGSRLIFINHTKNQGHGLEIPYDLSKQLLIDLGEKILNKDTFLIKIENRYGGHLSYNPVKIIVQDGVSNTIRMGENCFLLECVPRNDPWMPYVREPYLFCKTDYYLNPKTGRIQPGKKIINSQLYNACELKHFLWIDPNQIYLNLKAEKHSGYNLIQSKKINLKDWRLEAF